MYLQKVISKKTLKKKNNFLLPSWKPLTKRAGSGSVSQWYGSADLDPDPYQNAMGFTTLVVVSTSLWAVSRRGDRWPAGGGNCRRSARSCGCWLSRRSFHAGSKIVIQVIFLGQKDRYPDDPSTETLSIWPSGRVLCLLVPAGTTCVLGVHVTGRSWTLGRVVERYGPVVQGRFKVVSLVVLSLLDRMLILHRQAVLRIRNISFGSCFGSGSGLKLVSDPVSDPDPNPDSNPGSRSRSETGQIFFLY